MLSIDQLADYLRLITAIAASSLAGRLLPMILVRSRRERLLPASRAGVLALAMFSLGILLFALLALVGHLGSNTTMWTHPVYYMCFYLGHRYARLVENMDARDIMKREDCECGHDH